jgi:tRNA-uridine 2-sulfurtransferase
MKTVYVGMSGGVDSSVTAALLLEQGYQVVGVYMKNWTQDFEGVVCRWASDLADARAVAARLDIPLRVFDFQQEYRSRVVEYMVAEYQAGRTPNPDVMCNQEIKFKLFLDTSLSEGADLIATGHYARVEDGRLYAGLDPDKDQSYFLHRVTTQALGRTLMPIGGMRKAEVRALATSLGLATAAKPDSQGICFVGEVGMRTFLSQYVEAEPGEIRLVGSGRVLGQHQGAIYYTVGQRQGLGIGGSGPYYVTHKDMGRNTVYVTNDPADMALSGDRLLLADMHWIAEAPADLSGLSVRSRYRAQAIPARLNQTQVGWQVELEHPERAISPGQSAVVYRDDQVLGGGIITSTRG